MSEVVGDDLVVPATRVEGFRTLPGQTPHVVRMSTAVAVSEMREKVCSQFLLGFLNWNEILDIKKSS